MNVTLTSRVIYDFFPRDEYEETLMNQRKMFDDEIEELISKHTDHIDKLKNTYNDEKSKLEKQINNLKESTVGDSLGGTIKEAARCLDQCKYSLTFLACFRKIITIIDIFFF